MQDQLRTQTTQTRDASLSPMPSSKSSVVSISRATLDANLVFNDVVLLMVVGQTDRGRLRRSTLQRQGDAISGPLVQISVLSSLLGRRTPWTLCSFGPLPFDRPIAAWGFLCLVPPVRHIRHETLQLASFVRIELVRESTRQDFSGRRETPKHPPFGEKVVSPAQRGDFVLADAG
jgi:hypothetical protein